MPPTKTGGLESTRLFSFTMEDQRGKKPPKFEFCAGLIEKKSPEKDFAQNLLMYVLSHLGTANRFKTTGTYKSEKSGEVYHQPLVLSARMRSGMKVSVLGVRACLATLKKMASKMNDKVQAWIVCYLIDWIYGRQWIANSVKPALSNVFNGVISHLGIKKNPVFTKWSELSKMPTGALKKKLGWGQMSPKAAAQPLIVQRRRGNTLIVAAKQPQSPAAPPAAEPAPSSLVAAVEAEVAAPALSSAAAASQAARHTKAGQSQSKPSQKKSAPSPKHKKPSSSVSSASVSSASASFSAPASSFSASQQKPTPPQQRLKRQQKLGKSGTPRTRPRENTPSAQERAPAVTTLERPKKRQKIVERESASSAAESATNASAAGGQKQKSSQKPLIQKYRTPYYRDTGIPGNHVYPSDGGLSQNGDLPPPKSNEDEEAAEQNAPSHPPMMSRVYSDSHIHRQFHPAMAMTMGECLYFDEHAMDGDSLESAFTYNCYSL